MEPRKGKSRAFLLWYAAVAVGAIGFFTSTPIVASLGGLLAATFGLVLLTDFHGVATAESERGSGFGRFRTYQTPEMVRLTGAGIVFIGLVWMYLGLRGLA